MKPEPPTPGPGKPGPQADTVQPPNPPGFASDLVPPRPESPVPVSEGAGTNETRPEPDPAADSRRTASRDGRAPRGPYPTGND